MIKNIKKDKKSYLTHLLIKITHPTKLNIEIESEKNITALVAWPLNVEFFPLVLLFSFSPVTCNKISILEISWL